MKGFYFVLLDIGKVIGYNRLYGITELEIFDLCIAFGIYSKFLNKKFIIYSKYI